jgi:nuclear GTP-binding protein
MKSSCVDFYLFTLYPERKEDPGIPSAFPYKDRILAEVAEERRRVRFSLSLKVSRGGPNNALYFDQTAEEKQRRREAKLGAQAGTREEGEDGNSDGDDEAEDDAETGEEPSAQAFDGVVSVDPGRALTARPSTKSKSKKDVTPRAPTPEFPPVDDSAADEGKYPNLRAVLEAADVVVEVLDARDPMAFRSGCVEGFVAAAGNGNGKRVLFVLNKIGEFSLPCVLCCIDGRVG